jgi:uncharacterized protein YaaW (UPF0174 family)
MSSHIDTDFDLINVLKSSEESDLAILADFITDSREGGVSKGRVSLETAIRVQLDIFKRDEKLHKNIDLIAKEIQEFGGNSIANFFRGKGVPYREALEDVANHMDVKYESVDSVESIELNILLKFAIKSMDKMSPEEQRDFLSKISGGKVTTGLGPGLMASLQGVILAGGFNSYILATTVAQAVAKQLIGKGLTFAGTGALMKYVSVFAGPIGWAVTSIWTAFDLASPAYRVTVPCVVQVAYMRQKLKAVDLPRCKKCGEIMIQGQDFVLCPGCGTN